MEASVDLQQINLFQALLGLCALSSALGVVLSKNAVSAALCLMGTLLLTAFLYLTQGAFFAGIVQILIYAGAIAVLFVFIVMLLDTKESKVRIPGLRVAQLLAFAATLLFVVTTAFLFSPGLTELQSVQGNGAALSAKAISLNFVSVHMLPFQVTGLLILAAILGVVMLAKSVKNSRGKHV